jgi:hypothetical protein
MSDLGLREVLEVAQVDDESRLLWQDPERGEERHARVARVEPPVEITDRARQRDDVAGGQHGGVERQGRAERTGSGRRRPEDATRDAHDSRRVTEVVEQFTPDVCSGEGGEGGTRPAVEAARRLHETEISDLTEIEPIVHAA